MTTKFALRNVRLQSNQFKEASMSSIAQNLRSILRVARRGSTDHLASFRKSCRAESPIIKGVASYREAVSSYTELLERYDIGKPKEATPEAAAKRVGLKILKNGEQPDKKVAPVASAMAV